MDLREWEVDHNEAPDEEWTVEWMNILPKMEFALETLKLDSIHPRDGSDERGRFSNKPERACRRTGGKHVARGFH